MSDTNHVVEPLLKNILGEVEGMTLADWDNTPLGPVTKWPLALKSSFSLFFNSPLPKIICWGTDLRCIYNYSFIRFLKSHHRVPNTPGIPLKDSVPIAFGALAGVIDDILKGKEMTCNCSFRIGAHDKGILPDGAYNFLCNAIFESDDKVGGILLTVKDSEGFYDGKESISSESLPAEKILNLVNVGIAHVSAEDFKIRYLNNAFSELAGKPIKYFVDKPVFDLLPGKKDYLISVFEKVQESRKSIQQREISIQFSGNAKPVHLFLSLLFYPILNMDGVPDTIMIIAVDETQWVRQKNQWQEREHFFSKIVSHSRMGFLILRGNQFIVDYVNDTLIDRLWHLPREKVMGKPLLELFPELEEQKYGQQIRSVFQNNVSITEKKSHAFINSGKGMQEFYLDYEYAPITDDDGHVSGVSVNVYDVTAEVNSEREAEEARQSLEISLDATGLALWEWAPSGQITYTDALLKIFGQSRDGGLSMDKIVASIDAEDRVIRENAFKNATQSGLYEYEARIYKPDGVLAYIRVKGKMFFDHENKPLRIKGTTRDVTQEKLNEKEIIRKEQRLRYLILQAPVAIAILRGQEYKVEIVNKMAQSLLGKTQEQLLGKPVMEVMTELDTDKARYFLDKAFHNGEPVTAKEYAVKFLRNGKLEKVYVNFEYDPLRNEKDEVIGILAVGMEVTDQVIARKKIEASEQQFRLLANSVPHLVWITNKEGHIIFINETLVEYSGYTLDEFAEEGIFSIIHPDEKKKVKEKWQRALKTSTEFIDEHRLQGKDSRFRWYLTRIIPLRNEDETIQYWIATSTDIQEIKEQDFQKDYFISRASHELKTPLTSLKGYVDILKNVYHGSEEKLLTTSLDRMSLQVTKLTRLIEELLDTTRLNGNSFVIRKESVNLIQLLHETIEDISTIYPDYKIDVVNNEPIQVQADKTRISQVINNLLTNAIKYSPKEKMITIDAKTEGNMARISVTDHGIGIARHSIKNIFDKFYRVTGKNEDTYPGFGIGLYLVNEIVKKHGGYVTVESELGKGSCFTIFIPIE